MFKRWSPATCICFGLLSFSSASAQQARGAAPPEKGESAGPEDRPKPFDWRTSESFTGDWGGARTRLEEGGIRFKLKLMNQVMVNLHGGRETRNGHDTAGSYEFNLYFDLEKMDLIEGAEFWIRGKSTWGGDDSDFDREKIGGLFRANSDASREEPIFVDKWHWRQKLFDERLEFRIGRMEPVKDLFDTSRIIGHEDRNFINRALVRNATIPPRKGLGVFLKWRFTDDAYVSLAAIDADARDRQTNFNTAFHDDDAFRYFGELGCRPKPASSHGELSGHYRIGAWYDARPKARFVESLGGLRPAGRFRNGDWGLFCGFDQMLWKEHDDPDDRQGLAVAGRYGFADGEVNRIDRFWTAAVQYEGLVPGRDRDVTGFGVAQGILADEYRRALPRADRETVYELYYAIRVTPWLTVTPDFQFITQTGGSAGDPDTAVVGLRIRMFL